MQWSTGLVYKKEEVVDLKESAIKLYKKNRCFVGRKLYCFTQYEKNYTQILQEEKYNQEILSWSVRISLPDHSFTTVKTGVSQYQVNFSPKSTGFFLRRVCWIYPTLLLFYFLINLPREKQWILLSIDIANFSRNYRTHSREKLSWGEKNLIRIILFITIQLKLEVPWQHILGNFVHLCFKKLKWLASYYFSWELIPSYKGIDS